jgi:hypothetical protein
VRFIKAFQLRKRVPQGLKPGFLKVLTGTAKEAAEKLDKASKSSPQALKRNAFSMT